MKQLALLFLLIPFEIYSQNWATVGGGSSLQPIRDIYADTLENVIYTVGSFREIGGIPADRIAKWDGIEWVSLCDTAGVFDTSPIFQIFKYEGDLIIGGHQYDMAGEFCPYSAYLDDTLWRPYANPNASIFFHQSNNDLFSLGFFDSLNNQAIKCVARKTSSGWEQIGDPIIWNDLGFTYTATNFQNNIVVGGNFNVSGFKEIVLWDGQNWEALGNGVPGEAGIVFLEEYKGILYAGGWFDKSAGNPSNNLMAWDGIKWFDAFPDVTFNNDVRDMKIINDELYIVGSFNFNNDVNTNYTLSKFDGDNFCAFGGSFTTGNYQDVQRIAKLNDTVYIVCPKVLFGDTVNHIAKWLGNEMDTCINSPLHLGIQNQINHSISIYPNPSTSCFEVTSNEELVGISLYSQEGKLIYLDKFNQAQKKTVIQTYALEDGIYFIEIATDSGVARMKIQVFHE